MHLQYNTTTINLTSDVLDVLVDKFVQNLKQRQHPDISIWNRIENILSGLTKDVEYLAFNDTKDIFFSELIGVASGVYLLKDTDKELFEIRANFLKSIKLI